MVVGTHSISYCYRDRVYDIDGDEVLGMDMKKLKVILSKSTGYTYLEAKVVKEHIDALEKRMDKIDSFYDTVVKKIVKRVDKKSMKKVNKKNHIDLSARLHQIWAMIPLTAGMNARKEIKELIDDVEKKKANYAVDEIRELLFCHPLWGGKAKDTKEFANAIVLLFDILEFRRDN